MIRSDVPKGRAAYFGARSFKHAKGYLNLHGHEVKWQDLSFHCDRRSLHMIRCICPLWQLHRNLNSVNCKASNDRSIAEGDHLGKVCRSSQTRPEEGARGDGRAPPQGRRVGASEVEDGGVGVYGGTMDNRDVGCMLMRNRASHRSGAIIVSSSLVKGDRETIVRTGYRDEISTTGAAHKPPTIGNLVWYPLAGRPIRQSADVTRVSKVMRGSYHEKTWCNRLNYPSLCNSDCYDPFRGTPSLKHEVEEDITFLSEVVGLRAKPRREIMEVRGTLSPSRCDFYAGVGVGQFPFMETMDLFPVGPVGISPHSPLPSTIPMFMVTTVLGLVATVLIFEMAHENASMLPSRERGGIDIQLTRNQTLLGVV